jgi:hypothetical protein
MNTRILAFCIGFGCAALCMTEASAQLSGGQEGRPVTAEDIAGKKICWETGHWSMYAANGSFWNDRGDHHHKWSVPEPGVIEIEGHYRQTEVLPDGRLQSHLFNNHARKRPGGANIYHWGTVCA